MQAYIKQRLHYGSTGLRHYGANEEAISSIHKTLIIKYAFLRSKEIASSAEYCLLAMTIGAIKKGSDNLKKLFRSSRGWAQILF